MLALLIVVTNLQQIVQCAIPPMMFMYHASSVPFPPVFAYIFENNFSMPSVARLSVLLIILLIIATAEEQEPREPRPAEEAKEERSVRFFQDISSLSFMFLVKFHPETHIEIQC